MKIRPALRVGDQLTGMHQHANLSAEFHINLADAFFDNRAEAESGMRDAITDAEARLHRIFLNRPGFDFNGRGFLSRAAGAGRGGSRSGRAEKMQTVAGAALHAFDAAIGFEGSDDVFAVAFAPATPGTDVITGFGLSDDSYCANHVNFALRWPSLRRAGASAAAKGVNEKVRDCSECGLPDNSQA